MVGQVGVLISNGGAHSPFQWAEVTAAHVVQGIIPDLMQFGDDVIEWRKSRDPRAVEMARVVDRFQLDVRDHVEVYHAHVQLKERAGSDVSDDMIRHAHHRDKAVAGHVDVDALCGDIIGIASKHHAALGMLFSEGKGLELLRERLRKDFGSIMQIERQYRASGHVLDENHVARKG